VVLLHLKDPFFSEFFIPLAFDISPLHLLVKSISSCLVSMSLKPDSTPFCQFFTSVSGKTLFTAVPNKGPKKASLALCASEGWQRLF
jgi:hypothetical protein